MTAREQAAFNEGIRAAQQFALVAAVTLETRDDAGELRQQAAVAALQGLAAGLADAFLSPPVADHPLQQVFAAIAEDPATSGTVECPTCKGRLQWARDSYNGHLHGQCETEGCLRWMQ